MVVLRTYTEADEGQIKRLHAAQKHDYILPDLKKLDGMLIDEDHQITHALMLRKTAEAYWLFDPTKNSRESTLARLLILNKEAPKMAKSLGYTDACIWVPPEVNTLSFERTLLNLGWTKPEWTCYAREIK